MIPGPRVVVDTNVLVLQLINDPKAARFDAFATGALVHLSFQTVAELKFIARRRNWGARRMSQLGEVLSRIQIEGVTDEMIELWSRIMHDRMRAGRRIQVDDAWIAATALALDYPLVTNDRGFAGIDGLRILP